MAAAQAPISKCDVCTRGVDARFYCQECTQEMCKDCKTMHLRMNVSKNHTVVSIAKDGETDVEDKGHSEIPCSIHSRERIQMLCTTCEMPVCIICIADKTHKNHDLDHLVNATEKYRSEILQVATKTKQEISNLETSLQLIQNHVKDYIKLSDKTKSDIIKQRNEIKSQVDKIADDLIYEQEKRKIQEMKIMDSKTKEIQKILSENKDLLRSFKDNPETGINTILCIIKDIRQRRKKLASTVIIECTYPPVFVSSGTHDLPKMFGKLKLNMSYKDKSEYIPDGENRRKYLPAISTEVIAKIKPGGESIAISSLNNNESWCGNGCDLFLINTDGKVEITLKFANYIDGIAVSNTEEILFTESQGHHIKKYSSNGKVAIIANTLPYKTKGLCLTTEQDVLVCLYKGENDNKVVRMSLNGQIKQTIKYNKQNQSLFIDPTEVTENYNGDVCVVDNCNYVVVVNKDGKFKFKYPDFDLSTSIKPLCCYGIACDKLGNILLSDHKNNRIHQIDCDGNFLQFVLASEHGIEYPWGLSIDDEGKLWVCNETGDEVRVYKYRS